MVGFTDCKAQIPETPRKKSGKARNSRLRKVGKTRYCGLVSERIKTPKTATRSKGDYLCIICGSRFTRAESVNYHFPACVEKYGNPQGNHWNDHPSCASRGTRRSDAAPGPANSGASIEHEWEKQEEEAEYPIQFNPSTIASDFLRAIGEHPTLPPLNAHMEGRDLVSRSSARLILRLRNHKNPTAASPPIKRHLLRQHQADNEGEKVDAQQETITAESEARREKEEAEGKARMKTEEESDSMTQPQSGRPLHRNSSGNSTQNQASLPSQLGALPSGWQMGRTPSGSLFFVNNHTQIMTVDDPRLSTQPRPLSRLGGLPSGWEMRLMDTSNGLRVYFVNHNDKTTTWTDPRGPSP